MLAIAITQGFTEEERDTVASLYWEAFGRKLRPGFRDESTGVAVVRAVLRRDHMLVARRGDDVLGVCGFYEAGAGAADFGWSHLRRTLSPLAALRASVVLSVLSRSPRPDSLVLDGICVERHARGLGIGTSLLEAASEAARRRKARAVRLSVIDGNPRARALYERQGFVQVDRGALGPLSPVYGFDGYTTMELAVRR